MKLDLITVTDMFATEIEIDVRARDRIYLSIYYGSFATLNAEQTKELIAALTTALAKIEDAPPTP